MKGRYRKLLVGILAVGLCIGMAGCGASEETSVYLDYGTGIDEDGNYNNELYGMNINEDSGADPFCFYLSEEEDPEYGGYFYRYCTGAEIESEYVLNGEQDNVQAMAMKCWRSKDLYQWEACGSLPGGYTLVVYEEDWCEDKFWAPEVIRNPADGTYYMYLNAASKLDYGVEGLSNSSEDVSDRLYVCIATSDSPTGPFTVLYDVDAETGKRIPTINFHTGCNTEYDWSIIDSHPYFDDDGTFYLYLKKEKSSIYSDLVGIWGVKMLDMAHADYSTTTCLAVPNAVSVTSTPGQIETVTANGTYFFDEDVCIEAPFMLKHNGKYYLTYTANGLENKAYSVHVAVGDSPLGTFNKLDSQEGNPVLNGSEHGFMMGTGHHSFVEKDGQMYILYHRHNTIYVYSNGGGRSLCADRVNWVANADGLDILAVNGPSKSLQWLSDDINGHINLAQTADVKISTGTGAEYLNDEVISFYNATENYVMESEEGDVTITFKWDEPVSISSVMVYNAKNVESAFSKVSEIRFTLAEQPEWASQDYTYAVIRDLKFPSRYWKADSKDYIACAPAVAEFDEILVSQMTISIKEADRLMEINKFGKDNTVLKLSEIVILGGKK